MAPKKDPRDGLPDPLDRILYDQHGDEGPFTHVTTKPRGALPAAAPATPDDKGEPAELELARLADDGGPAT